ncbi:MAG: hypothetical protein JNG89_02455 [Planctomycetaceae bacterium]|nr:hypothetical protein [Planctomycetaceae bacterium]
MSDTDSSDVEMPFATFRGTLSGARATLLFRQQPLLKRCLTTLILVLFVTGVCAAMWWLFGRMGDRRSSGDIAILIVWPLMIWFTLRQQSTLQRGRTWEQLNRVFCGAYEAKLFSRHLDIRGDGIAQRFQYRSLSHRRIQPGRAYTRIGFDVLETRALLLPVEDSDPPRTGDEVVTFLRERTRIEQATADQPPELVSRANPPLPFGLTERCETIAVAGAFRQAAALEVLAEEQQRQNKPSRSTRFMTWSMAITALALLALLIAARFAGRQIPGKLWYLPLFLLVYCGITLYVQRKQPGKLRTAIDPSASLAEITGWVSAAGFAVFTEYAYLAATWQACDAVDIAENQVVVKYGNGEFFLLGRHTFDSDADWTRCTEWIRSARGS